MMDLFALTYTRNYYYSGIMEGLMSFFLHRTHIYIYLYNPTLKYTAILFPIIQIRAQVCKSDANEFNVETWGYTDIIQMRMQSSFYPYFYVIYLVCQMQDPEKLSFVSPLRCVPLHNFHVSIVYTVLYIHSDTHSEDPCTLFCYLLPS